MLRLRLATIFFVGLFAFSAKAQTNPLRQRVSVDADALPLEQVLYQLIDLADVKLVFSNNIIPDKKITLHLSNQRLSFVLPKLLQGTDLAWQISGELIVLKKDLSAPGVKSYTISGFVVDEASGEPLVGASVFCRFLGLGTITNTYGFYSLKIPAGENQIDVSYLGFKPMKKVISLEKDEQYNWKLSASVRLLEVIVTANDSTSQNTPRVSTHSVALSTIDLSPTLLGEKDVFRNIEMLSGIQTGADGVGGIFVRGGNASQNLVILDGVPVYSTAHAGGILSIFNGEVLRSAKVIKGGFPARYGGRLSSVVELRTKEGNSQKWSGWMNASLATVNFGLEGPIVKGKSSIILSGRKSLVNAYLKPHSIRQKQEKDDGGYSSYNFSDWNAKFNYFFSNKNKIYFNVYTGQDDFEDESIVDFEFLGNNLDSLAEYLRISRTVNWENKVAGFRWNHLFSDRLFSNTSISYSQLAAGIGVDYSDSLLLLQEGRRIGHAAYIGGFQSGIRELSLKQDFDFVPHPNEFVRFGLELKKRVFFSNLYGYDPTSEEETKELQKESIDANSLAWYWEKDIQRKKWTINYGLRNSLNWVSNTTYYSFEPRFSALYQLGKHSNLTMAYSRMTQFVHLLSPTSINLATDLWVPSTDVNRPQTANQWVLGYDRKMGKHIFLSIETYYKKMKHLLSFSEGSVLFNDWKKNVTPGEGTSKGLDVSFQWKKKALTFDLSYSFAFVDRKFKRINLGRRFPFKYDRRHDLKMTLLYKWKRLYFAANWVFGTGIAISLPRASYKIKLSDYVRVKELDAFYYGLKNNFRLPAYHRMDISLNYKFNTGALHHQLGIGVYNVYNNRNPLYYELRRRFTGESTIEYYFVQVTIAPILPSVSYSIKF